MAREPKSVKTETLTIRLDPKTRFILEYLSRLKGQTITTVVERAIVAAAGDAQVDDPRWPNNPDGWQYFWDVSDGIRALKMAERGAFFPTYEEEKRLAFCRQHWPFFYSSSAGDNFLSHYVDILWPNIDTYVKMHEEQSAEDFFAAGKAMQAAIQQAKLKPPPWPVSLDRAPKANPTGFDPYAQEIDDSDVPF